MFLGPRVGYLMINDYEARPYYGLDFEVMASDRIGLHYSVLFGAGYFHMPIGPMAGVVTGGLVMTLGVNAADDIDDLGAALGIGGVVFLLTAAIPESVHFHIPINKEITLVPYVSPLQLEFVRATRGEDTFMGGGLGCRVNILKNNSKAGVRISPNVEYKIHYADNLHPGLSGGLTMAFRLN